MEKNRIMEAFLSLGLLVLAVLCVAVPFFVLFTGDGTYSWQFGDPATKKMMAEIDPSFCPAVRNSPAGKKACCQVGQNGSGLPYILLGAM